MKALFVLKHPGVVRNLEPTLRLLTERGHALCLVFENTKTGESIEYVRRLEAELPGLVTMEPPALDRDAPFVHLATLLRSSVDYLRYLEPRYALSPALRGRAARAAPAPLVRAMRLRPLRSPVVVAALGRLLRAVEQALPMRPEVAAFLATERPDVVLVAPLVGIASRQADYLRAARRLGIRTAFQVLSWDNLTNKGLLRDVPDVTVVWNEAQAAEAVELHGVPRERIVVSGAASYDHWFAWQPSRTRAELCDEVGLRADRPFILYVCSSPFIAPDETAFVDRWIRGLRAAGGPLAEVGVLIRPHPQNAAQWHAYEPGAQVAVWPRGGEDPLEERSRRNYFDSIHHCAAVVGINTSALIESAILGRPVLTVLAPEFAGTQEGTLHFHHLARDGSGPLFVAASPEEHRAQLEDALGGRLDAPARDERFVRSFVRPRGLSNSAAPFVAEALERLAAGPAPTPGEPAAVRLLRPLLRPVDLLVARRERSARTVRRRAQETLAAGLAEQRLVAVRTRVGGGEGPVVAGPWLGSVANELLYWIPFLRWCCAQEAGLGARLVAVSSGGVGSWYADVAQAGYVELLDHLDPDELERLIASRADRGGMPRLLPGDDPDVRRLRSLLGDSLAAAPALGPDAMFDLARPPRKQQSALRAAGMLPLRPIAAGSAVRVEQPLPAEYLAVQPTFGPAFPDTAENRRVLGEVLDELGRHLPLVAVEGGFRAVDEGAAEDVDAARIEETAAATSLAVRTAVVAGAAGFVASYGGLCHLGPLLGVPTVALYAEPDRFRRHHVAAERALAGDTALGSFAAVCVSRANPVEAVLRALPRIRAQGSTVPFP